MAVLSTRSGQMARSSDSADTQSDEDHFQVIKEPTPESMSQWCKVKNAETGWGAGQMCNGWFTVEEVRETPDGVYAKLQPSHRFMMEEMVEQPEETALNRHVRKRLRKAMDQLPDAEKKEVVPVAKQKGLNPSTSRTVLT